MPREVTTTKMVWGVEKLRVFTFPCASYGFPRAFALRSKCTILRYMFKAPFFLTSKSAYEWAYVLVLFSVPLNALSALHWYPLLLGSFVSVTFLANMRSKENSQESNQWICDLPMPSRIFNLHPIGRINRMKSPPNTTLTHTNTPHNTRLLGKRARFWLPQPERHRARVCFRIEHFPSGDGYISQAKKGKVNFPVSETACVSCVRPLIRRVLCRTVHKNFVSFFGRIFVFC